MCRDLRRLTACQKQHRPNEPADWVDIPNGLEVHVMGDHRQLTICQKQYRQNEPFGRVDIRMGWRSV